MFVGGKIEQSVVFSHEWLWTVCVFVNLQQRRWRHRCVVYDRIGNIVTSAKKLEAGRSLVGKGLGEGWDVRSVAVVAAQLGSERYLVPSTLLCRWNMPLPLVDGHGESSSRVARSALFRHGVGKKCRQSGS